MLSVPEPVSISKITLLMSQQLDLGYARISMITHTQVEYIKAPNPIRTLSILSGPLA